MQEFYVLFLGLAVSLDALVAGVAYGVKKIALPFSSLCVVGAVTAVCTAVSMIAARGAGMMIDPQAAVLIGGVLLLMIGVWGILQEYLLKRLIPKEPDETPQVTLKMGRLLVNILADPEAVDVDRSKSISASEAVMLGLALGLDNMVATFAAGLLGMLPLYTPLVMGALQMALIAGGRTVVCRWLPERMKESFSYLGGVLFIIMGVLRLVK